MRPGEHPLRELARQALGERSVDVGDLLSSLVLRAEGESPDSPQTVLVVDQLEEVWTACTDEAERASFLTVLGGLAADERSSVRVVLAVRGDYLARLADEPGLAGPLADNALLVGTLSPAEVRRVVEQPARRAGLLLTEGLADAVVTDAGLGAGLLPLVSSCLTRLWERREGRLLTLGSYVAMGGLHGAIAHVAEDAVAALSDDARNTARILLLRLAGPGDGDGVTRRRVSRAELLALDLPHLTEVESALADARLLTVSAGHVEVAHEALFREWPRLREWLVEDASGRAVQRRLALAAGEWDAEGRDTAALWRGARLVAATEVARVRPEELTAVEHGFLASSRAAVEAEQRADALLPGVAAPEPSAALAARAGGRAGGAGRRGDVRGRALARRGRGGSHGGRRRAARRHGAQRRVPGPRAPDRHRSRPDPRRPADLRCPPHVAGPTARRPHPVARPRRGS